MGDITVTGNSTLGIKGVKNDEHVHIDLDKVLSIAPVAAHIKEVNHIDPISVDALHVSEVKNIEPISIDRFNVTGLPTVNLSVRQLPPLDMVVRQLPAISLGTYQELHLPSSYAVGLNLFGIEFLRIYLKGHTRMLPVDRYRREQANTPNQSFPVPVAAGNAAIPSVVYPAASPNQPAMSWGNRVRTRVTPGIAGNLRHAGHMTANPQSVGHIHVGSSPPVGYSCTGEDRRPTPIVRQPLPASFRLMDRHRVPSPVGGSVRIGG